MTVPGYIISRDEENILTYHHTSPLTDSSHPIRKEIEELRAAAEYGEEGYENPVEDEVVAGQPESEATETTEDGGDE